MPKVNKGIPEKEARYVLMSTSLFLRPFLMNMDDAVVPCSRSRTPVPASALSGSSPVGDGLGDLALLMESRPVEHDARRLGERLSLLGVLGNAFVPQIVEALRWIFVDWTIAGIVCCLRTARFPPTAEVRTMIGLTTDWEDRHVAELLALMYFMPRIPVERRKVAFEMLKGIPQPRAIRIVTHLRSMMAPIQPPAASAHHSGNQYESLHTSNSNTIFM